MNTQVILEDFKWENFATSYDYVLGPSEKNLNNYYSLGDLTTWS